VRAKSATHLAGDVDNVRDDERGPSPNGAFEVAEPRRLARLARAALAAPAPAAIGLRSCDRRGLARNLAPHDGAAPAAGRAAGGCRELAPPAAGAPHIVLVRARQPPRSADPLVRVDDRRRSSARMSTPRRTRRPFSMARSCRRSVQPAPPPDCRAGETRSPPQPRGPPARAGAGRRRREHLALPHQRDSLRSSDPRRGLSSSWKKSGCVTGSSLSLLSLSVSGAVCAYP
jgi:hypothetical protein